MIPTDRLDRIVVELTMGKDPKPENDEERRFIESVREELNQAKKDKQIIRIPPEIP